MWINVSSISNKKEFVAKGEISASDVDAYFAEEGECRALSPLKYEARLLAHSKYIALNATAQATLELSCHRCGAPFTRELSLDLSLKLIEASSVAGVEEVILSEDDLDTVTYQNSGFDLDAILLESVYLEIDGECVCDASCKGICTQCGKNLNSGACDCTPNQ